MWAGANMWVCTKPTTVLPPQSWNTGISIFTQWNVLIFPITNEILKTTKKSVKNWMKFRIKRTEIRKGSKLSSSRYTMQSHLWVWKLTQGKDFGHLNHHYTFSHLLNWNEQYEMNNWNEQTWTSLSYFTPNKDTKLCV